jgi:formate hydrogenlyase transcriptional activator
MRMLVGYSWPGNIRELQNDIERGVVLSKGPMFELGADILPIEESSGSMEPEVMPEPASTDSLQEMQRRHVLRVLERTGWLINGPNGAGAVLNLHPNTLRSWMKRLGIRRATRGAVVAATVPVPGYVAGSG